MEKITKLHPVFLTFEGWVSTEGDVTVPENTMGACPKCWSPVVREELTNGGGCVCCGWKDGVEKVIHQDNQMIYQIQYNSSKHQPGGALPFLDYWKSRRALHIAMVKTNWILENTGSASEVPVWLQQLEALGSESIEARKAMLQRLGILNVDGKLTIQDSANYRSFLEHRFSRGGNHHGITDIGHLDLSEAIKSKNYKGEDK